MSVFAVFYFSSSVFLSFLTCFSADTWIQLRSLGVIKVVFFSFFLPIMSADLVNASKWFILFLESLSCGLPLTIVLEERLHKINIKILVYFMYSLAELHQYTGPDELLTGNMHCLGAWCAHAVNGLVFCK